MNAETTKKQLKRNQGNQNKTSKRNQKDRKTRLGELEEMEMVLETTVSHLHYARRHAERADKSRNVKFIIYMRDDCWQECMEKKAQGNAGLYRELSKNGDMFFGNPVYRVVNWDVNHVPPVNVVVD